MKTKINIQIAHRLHQFNITVSVAVVVIIMTMTLANHLFDKFNDLNGTNLPPVISYKISSGDTLWSLTSRTITEEEDLRDKIISIRKINGLAANQQLYPGQIIQIPVNQSTIENFRLTINSR